MFAGDEVYLPTTEDHEWVQYPFTVKRTGLPKGKARRCAIWWRRRGYMARVRPNADGYFVAVFNPRRISPRRCDLTP